MEVIYPWLGWIWGGVGLVSGKEDVRAYSSAVKWCNKNKSLYIVFPLFSMNCYVINQIISDDRRLKGLKIMK